MKAANRADLREKVEQQEERINELEETIKQLASEAGVGPMTQCFRCDDGRLVMQDGYLECTKCGYRTGL